ncbi:GDSL esterase/lipase At5g55050-like [Lotus japonicus]|uniref:GDSL esterase/lipase At5g55050-like n=1 Tax=Lotus japonicus TaxID=34305 RepID=UPI00258F6F55|nr:GDSL esterase/lipase At5g55050-like [Lotus japonicus]
MAFFFNNKHYITASILFSILFSLAMFDIMHIVAHEEKAAPTLFIFGDSAFDVGTNNFLMSRTKANFPYNGIDFNQSFPTGRFSNGLNTADQIARRFGYTKSPPPFLALEKLQYTFKHNILLGVNFASGGSGVLRYTGYKQSGEVVSLEKQVEQFELVCGNITEILGPEKATTFVSKALFLISVGSNDILDYTHGYSSVFQFGKEEHLAVLQHNYYLHIKKLYELGARKFGILSVPPIGCYPAATSTNEENCVKSLNEFAVAFYKATHALMQKLSSELGNFEYSLGNTYAMTTTMLKDPLAFGMKDTKSACCGFGRLNGWGPCVEAFHTNVCVNRTDYLFWDWFNPTEKASELVAKTLFEGGTEFVFPMNFSQLIN